MEAPNACEIIFNNIQLKVVKAPNSSEVQTHIIFGDDEELHLYEALCAQQSTNCLPLSGSADDGSNSSPTMESDREHAASPSTSGPSTNNHHRTGEPIQVLSVIELPNYLDPIAANGREHLSDATDHQPASPSTFEPSTSNHHNMGEQDIIELSSDEEDSRYAVAEPVAVAEPETSTMFPIKCNIGSSCMAVFKTTDGFVEHLHAHHDTRKRMICYLCRRRDSFETKRALRRHMESWHICQMRFQCPFKRCMLSFTREHQLTLHMITHVFNLLNENIN